MAAINQLANATDDTHISSSGYSIVKDKKNHHQFIIKSQKFQGSCNADLQNFKQSSDSCQ